jgi:hypothetical protein
MGKEGGGSRITKLHSHFEAMQVEEGDPLAEHYSPVVTAQKELLTAPDTPGTLSGVDLVRSWTAVRKRSARPSPTVLQVTRMSEVDESVPSCRADEILSRTSRALFVDRSSRGGGGTTRYRCP